MKKKIFLIFGIILIPICFIVIFLFYTPSNLKNIGDSYYNNSYVNYSLNNGNLLRVDNKLYYNYKPNNNPFKYGMYEITEEGNKKLYSPGFVLFPNQAPLFGMQSHDDNLLVSPGNFIPYGLDITAKEENYIVKMDLDKSEFVFTDYLNGLKNDYIEDYYAFDDIVFLVGEKNIYSLKNNKIEKLVNLSELYDFDIDLKSAFFCSEGFYFFSASEKDFRFYDLKTKEIKKLVSADMICQDKNISSIENINHDFFVVNNNLMFTYSSKSELEKELQYLYKVDLKNGKTEKVCELPYSCTYFNYRGSNIYSGSEYSGVYLIDSAQNRILRHIDLDSKGVYITDDDFVYIKGADEALYRTDDNLMNSEKVFG